MKKFLTLIAIICIPMIASAMKIDTDEIDEFTGKHTVITSWESFAKGYIHIRFRYQADTYYLDFKYITERSIVIGEGASLLYKAEDGDMAKFSSTAIFSGERGSGAVGISGGAKWGIYANYTGPVEWFASHSARLMRIYSTDGYTDKKLSEGEGAKLTKLALILDAAVNKDSSTQTARVITCTVAYMRKPKNKQDWEVVYDEYLKDALYDDVQDKAAKWRSQADNSYDYDVKITRERK